jgi:protein SCO1/2
MVACTRPKWLRQITVAAAVLFSQCGATLGLAQNLPSVVVPAPGQAAWSEVHGIPDTPVLDQDGKRLRFYSDLLKDRVVVIDFVFTGCSTICPGLSTTFRNLQDLPGAKDVSLISITVDPANDGPAQLKAYAATFDAQPGWTLVTGRPDQIAKLSTAFGVAAGSGTDHTSMFVVIDAAAAKSTVVSGSASAAELLNVARNAKSSEASTGNPNARYFSNLKLQTQDGQTVRFFDDLLRDRVAVIDFIFTRCVDICSPATNNLAQVQQNLGERLGRLVNLISISVDSDHDRPDILKRYAEEHGAGPGWTFLTGLPGKRENLDWVAHRLGGYTDDPALHGTMLIIGNEAAGLWMKLPVTTDPSEILKAIERAAAATKEHRS